MIPYILISLWSPEDESTPLSHGFAEELRARRAPITFIAGESPHFDEIRRAAAATPEAAVVVFGHGGHCLCARAGGPPWCSPGELAELLGGRRVYAFACSTFTPQPRLVFDTFAAQAVSGCVQVFAGHRAPVMAPLVELNGGGGQMRDALFHLIEQFIDGEQDERALQNIGRMYAAWDLPIELDLPSEDPQQEGAFGWSSSAFIGAFFNSLCVRSKGPAAAAPEAP